MKPRWVSPKTYPPRAPVPGFTLVELLVAIAILLLILAVCSALTLTAQNLLNNGMQRIDADSQARLFFDRVTLDLQAMPKRTDIDYIVKDATQIQTGNDSMAFYARTSGYFTTSPDAAPRTSVAVLAYRINSQTYQCERLAKGIGWNSDSSGTPMVFLPSTLFGTWPTIAGTGTGTVPDLNLGTDSDYQVLAQSVFRFEYCYVLRDGTISNLPYISTHTALNGWQDVLALYVAIAVLDDRSRLVISQGGSGNPNLSAATAALKDFNLGNGQAYPPLAQWESVINQASFSSSANLPGKVGPAVRIYARSIPINNWPPDTTL
jgi:prepilin-type N-terminal cleavage/methylation domain-containing protein